MTYAAFGVHRQLIEDEGFDPASDEYYNELDKRSVQSFHKSLRKQSAVIQDPESLLRSPVLLKHRQERGAEQSN